MTDGQGIYKWTDYNGDGIQQLDEFEIAEYSDLAIHQSLHKYGEIHPSNKNKLQLSLSVNPYIVLIQIISFKTLEF